MMKGACRLNIALIIAGGSGQRTHQDIPKQFLSINDKPIIIYAMEAFQAHPFVDSIIAVCIDGWHEMLRAYAKQFSISKLQAIVRGGETRRDSIKAGLNALDGLYDNLGTEDILLVHDANRPLVSVGMVDECIAKAKEHGACVMALPCYDWMLWTDTGMDSTTNLDKRKLVRAQTPEALTYAKVKWAYAQELPGDGNDLSSPIPILVALGEKVHFARGSERLMKITTTEDFEIIKALINVKASPWLKA